MPENPLQILERLGISIEATKVMTYQIKGVPYAKVQKVVPREWAGEEVIIMRRKDLDKLLRYVNAVIDLVDEVIEKTALKRTFIMETRAKEVAKESANIKLSKDDFNLRLRR